VTLTARVTVRRLHPQALVPTYAHPGDAGADLASVVAVTLGPGERALVPTGIAIALPPGFVGLIHPRSGAAARHGLGMVNAPGTIDSGYRGEILINLINLDPHDPIEIRPGDRVAQLVIQEYAAATFAVADSLPGSARGETGHGSTGGLAAATLASDRDRAAGADTAPTTDED